MSLDKAIEHGKEKRKPYRKAKAKDKTCRSHGTCPACRMNREHKKLKIKISTKEQLKEREELQ